MRERVEQPAPSDIDERLEVATPSFLDAERIEQAWLAVDTKALDVVHRAEQVIPRIGIEQLACLVLAARHVVDLQVRLEVVDATLGLIRHRPEGSCLPEVVDVLGEPDLVDAGLLRRLYERLDRPRVVRDLLAAVAQVHVVVDDHNRAATHSRSSASVIFRRRRSPSTTFTRPPRASTSEAQSLAPETSPRHASRRICATKAWGVCTTRKASRSSVSTTRSPSTRLTVSATGSAGTAPSQPSFNAVKTRSTTSSSTSGRAASCTSTTAASAGTSESASRTESARVVPPVTQELTLLQPSSSASRIEGSSHSGGAATTIASTQSEASNRSRLSASNGRSPRRTNALGRSAPSRSPLPAAARMAQTLTSSRRAPSSSACSSLRALRSCESPASPSCGQQVLSSSTRPSPASPRSSCGRCPCR